ncbi:MAG: hypothetical protein ACOY16_06830 [Chloroflexota bacterium]
MGKTKDRQMKIIFLSIIAVASFLLCGCAGEQPSTEGPIGHPLEQRLTNAAMDTVISFNRSGMREATSPAEIPQELWAPEIEDLKPLKVYWYNNNLAIVLKNSSSDVNGIYVYVPISSYLPNEYPFPKTQARRRLAFL